MIATINLDSAFLDESISTCKFAQRVALIKNVAVVNEEVDTQVMISRLKKEVASLKEELAVLKSNGDAQDVMTSEQQSTLKQRVSDFITDDSNPLICGTMTKIRAAFGIFRNFVLEARTRNDENLPMLNQVPKQVRTEASPLQPRAVAKADKPVQDTYSVTHVEQATGMPIVEILLDRAKAFEAFKLTCPQKASEITQADKDLLKQLCEDGKALGVSANESRAEANRLKAKLDAMRLCDAMRSASGQVDDDLPEYTTLRDSIDNHKQVYQKSADKLRDIKAEIDRIQSMAAQNKKRIQRDFETWFTRLREQVDPKSMEDSDLDKYFKLRDEILNSYHL